VTATHFVGNLLLYGAELVLLTLELALQVVDRRFELGKGKEALKDDEEHAH
jgi:hypothetical protein